ncbi:MAG: hypothetical protein HYZ42_04935 [Bacteroidetes bacterium]|nr:hypothetical protein [Bacteroidota bacterium]
MTQNPPPKWLKIILLIFFYYPFAPLIFLIKGFRNLTPKILEYETKIGLYFDRSFDELRNQKALNYFNSYTVTFFIQISGLYITIILYLLTRFIGIIYWVFTGFEKTQFTKCLNFLPIEQPLVYVIFTVALIRVIWTLTSISARLRKNMFAGFNQFLKNSISGIILNIFGFAVDYTILYFFVSHSFNVNTIGNKIENVFSTFFYFSTVTFATVGYGDIFPTRLVTRSIVTLEIITSFVLIVIILTNYSNLKSEQHK